MFVHCYIPSYFDNFKVTANGDEVLSGKHVRIYLMAIENAPIDFGLCLYTVFVRVVPIQKVELQTICVFWKMTLSRMKYEPKIRSGR